MSKIIKIENSELSVSVSTLGAELMSVSGKGGTEFLWNGDKNVWSGRAPLLFPICGGLKDGKYIYEGECIGYGIPYSTSYTQPESYYASGGVVPQADPNALYSNGVTTSATWILSLDEKGDVYPRYEEREIAVSQTKIPKRLCEEYSLPEDY